MAIKKFFAKADTTIYDALSNNTFQRSKNSNTGLADSLELFYLFGQDLRPLNDDPAKGDIITADDKKEQARIIINPGLQDIRNYYGAFPSNVKFVLRLFNVEHPFTLPKNFSVELWRTDEVWVEGRGLDMEDYSDVGYANWENRDPDNAWANAGVIPSNEPVVNRIATQTFEEGTEDLEIDITDFIENTWDTVEEISFVLKFPEQYLQAEENFYTKKFSSRSSEFFYKRPVIEARSSNTISDDRGRLYKAVPYLNDNTQNLFLYNSFNGTRASLGVEVRLNLHSDAERTNLITSALASEQSTGIYKATVTIPSETDTGIIYEQWTSDGDVVKTGEVKLNERSPETDSGEINYVVDVMNLKSSYSTLETAKFRIYTRQKDWNPTIYTVASKERENLIVDKIYYKIIRLIDDSVVIDYGIGSSGLDNEHTLVSYDASGSYFDFDMSLLEEGYMYGIKLMFSINGEMREQEEIFKFRVG